MNNAPCPRLHSRGRVFFVLLENHFSNLLQDEATGKSCYTLTKILMQSIKLYQLKLTGCSIETTEIPTAVLFGCWYNWKWSKHSTLFTFFSHPTFHAGFVSILITCVVTNKIISRATKFIAQSTVVIFITLHPYLYFKIGNGTIELECLPAIFWVDHACMCHSFY